MGYRRRVAEKLPAKLLAIRQAFGASQSQMARVVNLTAARICEYEKGTREPNMLVLLAYARIAHIPLEKLIDDTLDLNAFVMRLKARPLRKINSTSR